MGNITPLRTTRQRRTGGRRFRGLSEIPRRTRRRRTTFVPWLPIMLIALGAGAYLGLERLGIDPVPPAVREAMVELRDAALQHRVSVDGAGDLPVVHGPAPSPVTFTLCRGQMRNNCVVDGDTIWYRGDNIRLADIDTPEVSEPRCASEAALGRRATERLLALINGGPVRIVPAGGRDVDRYGRKLRIVEIGGRSLGAILVAEGLARPWNGARRSWCA